MIDEFMALFLMICMIVLSLFLIINFKGGIQILIILGLLSTVIHFNTYIY